MYKLMHIIIYLFVLSSYPNSAKCQRFPYQNERSFWQRNTYMQKSKDFEGALYSGERLWPHAPAALTIFMKTYDE